ncbi:hypothetical protein ACVW0Y_004673 [Pseudomonas sp. TE3786]
MIRLVCLIITASSVFFAALAVAQDDIELTVRVRNERASVVSGAHLCGLLPLAGNGVAEKWQVEGPAGLQLQDGNYCVPLEDFGPHQVTVLRLRWSSLGVAEEQAATPNYLLTSEPSSELKALADSFSSYPQAQRPERIYEWMVDNIEFAGIRRGIDGAELALSQRKGDCTEHMLLAAELLARNGFEVRRVLGVALSTEQNRISSNDLHNWLEYLDNGTWHIFDSSKRIFIKPEGLRYIALLYYQNSQQLSLAPFTTDAPDLALYLQ